MAISNNVIGTTINHKVANAIKPLLSESPIIKVNVDFEGPDQIPTVSVQYFMTPEIAKALAEAIQGGE